MQNVLIHGNSGAGAGKNMTIEKFIRYHSLEVDRGDAAQPIVSMRMPPFPSPVWLEIEDCVANLDRVDPDLDVWISGIGSWESYPDAPPFLFTDGTMSHW